MGSIRGKSVTNLTIIAATIDDISAVHEIYANSVLTQSASWEYEPPSLEQMHNRFLQITNSGFPYFVAKIDGYVVGYAYASQFRERIGYRFCVEDSIYVREGFHGKGIGKALLLKLIDTCANNGFTQMIAVIGENENSASIVLHEKCGFSLVGTLPKIGFKFDKWLDSVIMQRRLA